MNIDDFAPEIVDDRYATFLVRLQRCASCKQLMVKAPKELDAFPVARALRFSEQAERAGIKLQSDVTADNQFICIDCAQAGRGGFTCRICLVFKPSDKIHTTIGSSVPDHLCTDCYDTVPAQEWNETVDELKEKHKYDDL